MVLLLRVLSEKTGSIVLQWTLHQNCLKVRHKTPNMFFHPLATQDNTLFTRFTMFCFILCVRML